MSRNRAWRRKKNYSKGKRKQKIAIALFGYPSECIAIKTPFNNHVGQYIKGKVHCSCMMCSAKTNNRGRYGRAINYKHSDEMKVNSMKEQIHDYEEGLTYEND